MLGRLAVAAVLVASLAACTPLIYAGISFGASMISDGLGISAAIKSNIRQATGACVSETFKTIPCPPPQEPAKP